MTKSNLHTGMVVTLRNGKNANVYKETYSKNWYGNDLLTDGEICLNLNDYTEDLICSWNNNYDIMDVRFLLSGFRLCKDPNDSFLTTELLWKREEPRRMTLAEIEAKLGYKVEIVEEE